MDNEPNPLRYHVHFYSLSTQHLSPPPPQSIDLKARRAKLVNIRRVTLAPRPTVDARRCPAKVVPRHPHRAVPRVADEVAAARRLAVRDGDAPARAGATPRVDPRLAAVAACVVEDEPFVVLAFGEAGGGEDAMKSQYELGEMR